MTLEYKPFLDEFVSITGITGVSAEQLLALTSPFVPGSKPTVIASLSAFSLTTNVPDYFAHPFFNNPEIPGTAALLPRRYRLKLFVWVKGGAALAGRSYAPTPGYASGLYRLAPRETGAEIDDSEMVEVDFGEVLSVVRFKLVFRGLFDPSLPPPT